MNDTISSYLHRPSFLRRIRAKIAGIIFREHWMIGIVDAPIALSIGWKRCPKVHWLGERSQARYLADPFCWPGSGNTILCEEYDFAKQHGSIKRLSIEGDKIAGESHVDILLPGHLSFPFLFAHEGEVYCMPESGAAQALKILCWEKDAFKEYATPLPHTAATDSVLFRHGDYFWIAYTDIELGIADNLNLCFAETLTGPWRMHPSNPVKRGLASSRNGGTPFMACGALHRVVQDCARTYGGSIRILRILECTPERYREEEVTHILPEQGMNPHGFHTLNAWGDRCLVDGKWMEFSLVQIASKLLSFFTRT